MGKRENNCELGSPVLEMEHDRREMGRVGLESERGGGGLQRKRES